MLYIENVCPRGHQLHPITFGKDWICDGCGYECGESHEGKDVVVWRCEHDLRHPRGELVGVKLIEIDI